MMPSLGRAAPPPRGLGLPCRPGTWAHPCCMSVEQAAACLADVHRATFMPDPQECLPCGKGPANSANVAQLVCHEVMHNSQLVMCIALNVYTVIYWVPWNIYIPCYILGSRLGRCNLKLYCNRQQAELNWRVTEQPLYNANSPFSFPLFRTHLAQGST